MADFWNTLTSGATNILGSIVNPLQAGNMIGDVFSNLTGIGRNSDTQNFTNGLYPTATPAVSPSPISVQNKGSSTSSTSNSMDEWNKILAQLTALQKSTPAQPRFINYDTAGSWDKARQMATDAVSPVYAQKLTDFINNQAVQATRQATDTTTGKSTLDTQLEQMLADSATNAGRTGVDTATAVNDLSNTQKYNTRQEGLSFDTANRALTAATGAAGLSDSGLGKQQIEATQMARRDQSNEQVRQIENKVEAANTLMNRTFQDLQTKDTRGTQSTTEQKSVLDLNLERFMEDQVTSLDQEKKAQELSKQGDIASKSIGIQKSLADQWIQSLSGKGYTSQEIANAASIYG